MKSLVVLLVPFLFLLSCSHSPYPTGDVDTKKTPYVFTKNLLTMDAKNVYKMFSPKVTNKLKVHQLTSIQRNIKSEYGKLVKFVTEKTVRKNVTSVSVVMERRAMNVLVVEDGQGKVSGFGWETAVKPVTSKGP